MTVLRVQMGRGISILYCKKKELLEGEIVHKAFEDMSFGGDLEEYFEDDFQRWGVVTAVAVTTGDFDGRFFDDVPRDALPSVPVESLHGAVETFTIFVADAQAERVALFLAVKHAGDALQGGFAVLKLHGEELDEARIRLLRRREYGADFGGFRARDRLFCGED